VDTLAKALAGYDTIISAIGPDEQLAQLKLVDAIAKAGVGRFVPCGFTTVCPPEGVMLLRDEKEKVYNRVLYHRLPYTFIDVGFWHQISFPRVPSGRLDYASLAPNTTIYGDGEARNLLTDKRDMGRFVSRIIKDDRTLNKKVFTHSDAISQKEIWEIVEKVTGEKISTSNHVSLILPSNTTVPSVHNVKQVSEDEVREQVKKAEAALATDPKDPMKRRMTYVSQYNLSKYIRRDNSPENAKYLEYLDAKELYPDFKPVSFKEYVAELMDGKGKKPYSNMTL
jgi:nucleoside-diphosphate-sugar epimerase